MHRLVCLSLLAAACAGAGGAHPISAVDDYVAALRVGDYVKAYSFMSERYKKEHAQDDFIRMMKESPQEVRETTARLSSPERKVEVAARFVYDDLHDELALVQENGVWKISGDPLDFYPQDSPNHTLRSFVRAVELKRYDIVLRFVPNKWKEEMTEKKIKEQFEGEKREEVGQMMRLLIANLDNPIDQQGDEARMPYGDRFEVKFVREDGIWKIADPD
jgi:hypothetical protein